MNSGELDSRRLEEEAAQSAGPGLGASRDEGVIRRNEILAES